LSFSSFLGWRVHMKSTTILQVSACVPRCWCSHSHTPPRIFLVQSWYCSFVSVGCHCCQISRLNRTAVNLQTIVDNLACICIARFGSPSKWAILIIFVFFVATFVGLKGNRIQIRWSCAMWPHCWVLIAVMSLWFTMGSSLNDRDLDIPSSIFLLTVNCNGSQRLIYWSYTYKPPSGRRRKKLWPWDVWEWEGAS